MPEEPDKHAHQGHVGNIFDECLHAVTALTNNFSNSCANKMIHFHICLKLFKNNPQPAQKKTKKKQIPCSCLWCAGHHNGSRRSL